MTGDLYVIMQVPPKASPEEIRSAYRRRALELHPDKSGGDSEAFLELQRAYSVLGDPAQRRAYDASAVPVIRRRGRTLRTSGAEPLRPVEHVDFFRDVSLSDSFGTFGPSFDEVFERLWSNFHGITRPKAERLESLTVDVPLSRDEAFAGGHVMVMVPARTQCRACGGTGEVGFYHCWRCRGEGAITAEMPVDITYPSGLRHDHVVRVGLDELGIPNFFLTVRLRPIDR